MRSRRLQRVEGRKLRVETAKDMNIVMVFWSSTRQAIFSPRLGLLSTFHSLLSTFYSLPSTLYLLIPWLLGLFAFSRLLQRDGRWGEDEPVRNRLIKECRRQVPLASGHNAINPGGLGAEPPRRPSSLLSFFYQTKPKQRLRYLR